MMRIYRYEIGDEVIESVTPLSDNQVRQMVAEADREEALPLETDSELAALDEARATNFHLAPVPQVGAESAPEVVIRKVPLRPAAE